MWAAFAWSAFKTLLLNVAIGALTTALQLRKQPKAPRYSLSDFTYNTNDQGRALTRVFGRVPVVGHMGWWGNYRAREVTKKVRVFGFSVGKQSLGWEYYIGMWLHLTGGCVERVRAIYYGDKLVWSGNVALSKTGSTSIAVDKRWDEAEGAQVKSGLSGTFVFWNIERQIGDNSTLPVDSYLAAQLGESPPMYPGTCHVRFDGFVGTSPQIPSIKIVVEDLTAPAALLSGRQRTISYPVENTLLDGTAYAAVQAFVDGARNVNGSANPVFALAEIATKSDPSFGARMSPYLLDFDSFMRAAHRVKEDGLGVDFPWESTTPSSEQIEQLLQLINGHLDHDPRTGLLKLELVREDDAVSFDFTSSNIIRLGKFERSVISEAPNVFEVRYADRADKYLEKTCTTRNIAGVRGAGREIKVSQDYLGVSTRDVASRLVTRLKRSSVSSLASLEFTGVVPGGTVLKPGQLITVDHETEGLLRMRILSARYGDYSSRQEVDIEAIEDVFRDGNGSLAGSDPGTTLPEDVLPSNAVEAARVFYAPAALTDGENDQAMVLVAPSSAYQTAYRVEMALTTSGTFDDETAFRVDGVHEFAAYGTTTGAVAENASFSVQLSAASAAVVARNNAENPTPYVCLGNPTTADHVWIRATAVSLDTGTNVATINTANGHGVWGTWPLRFAAGTEAWIAYDWVIDPGVLQTVLTRAFNDTTVAATWAGYADSNPWAFIRAGNRENPAPVQLPSMPGTEVGGFGSATVSARPWTAGRTRINGVEGAFAETDSLPLVPRAGTLSVSWVNRSRASRADSAYGSSTTSGVEQNSRTVYFIDTRPAPGSGTWIRRHTGTLTAGESQSSLLASMDSLGVASGSVMRLIVRTEQFVGGQWVFPARVDKDEDFVASSLGALAGRARYYQLT